MSDQLLPSKKRPRLTRRERLKEQKEQNKRWREHDRKVGSGVDPNPRHTKYFQLQLPLDLNSSSEWTAFQQSMATPLPVVIRLGWACPRELGQWIARVVAAWRPRGFLTLPRASADGADTIIRRENPVVSTLFPGESWQLVCDAQTLSNNEALSHVHGKICTHVSLGHLVRQELASQLPVLVAQVEPHHHVLDMCAAPGSKTEQLLGLVSAEAGGMVVANDLDKKRLSTLCQRLGAGAPHLLVIQSRAEDLPRVAAHQFDRIICDVPCSGDGTLRKFPHLWRLFRPRVGVDLHSIQLQIAVAAAKLLKPGGRLVYSTCSINPIEDEAVVSGLLQHGALRGQLKLVQCSVPAGIVTRPGVSTWKCDAETFTVGEQSREEALASLQRLPTLTESMRPPPASLNLHLEYCHRILPHDQDTGGFFFAVLERLGGHVEDGLPSSVRVSLQEATRTMKRLGYNPKAGNKGGRETEAKDAEEEAEASYHLLDQEVLCGERDSSSKIKFISRDGQQVSVATIPVIEALSSWAASGDKKKKNDKKSKRRNVVVRQAGANIGSWDSRFYANADHFAPLFAIKCLGPEVAQVVEISHRQEFARLCALGVTQRVVEIDVAGLDLGAARTIYVVFFAAIECGDRRGDGAGAQEGKKRLSKAEKRRLKSAAPPLPHSQSSPPHSDQQQEQQQQQQQQHQPGQTSTPMILTLQKDDEPSSLSFLSSVELCQTYSEAVLDIL